LRQRAEEAEILRSSRRARDPFAELQRAVRRPS
jgi:hypothetical protein